MPPLYGPVQSPFHVHSQAAVVKNKRPAPRVESLVPSAKQHKPLLSGRLLALPCETLCHILSYLGPRDLSQVALSCRTLRAVVDENALLKAAGRYYYGATEQSRAQVWHSQSRAVCERVVHARQTTEQREEQAEQDPKSLPNIGSQLGRSAQMRAVCQQTEVLPQAMLVGSVPQGKTVWAGSIAGVGECYIVKPDSVASSLKLQILDTRKWAVGEHLLPDSQHHSAVVVLDDGSILAAHHSGRRMSLWRYVDNTIQTVAFPLSGPADCATLKSTGGGRVALVGMWSGDIHVQDIDSLPHAPRATPVTVLPSSGSYQKDFLVLSARHLVSLYEDGTLKVFDLQRAVGNECVASLNELSSLKIKRLVALDHKRFLIQLAQNVQLIWQVGESAVDCLGMLDPGWKKWPACTAFAHQWHAMIRKENNRPSGAASVIPAPVHLLPDNTLVSACEYDRALYIYDLSQRPTGVGPSAAVLPTLCDLPLWPVQQTLRLSGKGVVSDIRHLPDGRILTITEGSLVSLCDPGPSGSRSGREEMILWNMQTRLSDMPEDPFVLFVCAYFADCLITPDGFVWLFYTGRREIVDQLQNGRSLLTSTSVSAFLIDPFEPAQILERAKPVLSVPARPNSSD